MGEILSISGLHSLLEGMSLCLNNQTQRPQEQRELQGMFLSLFSKEKWSHES
jgi:hypothetical protein